MTADRHLQLSSTVKTPYGHVDAAALAQLRGTFDTTGLLRAIDQLDELRTEHLDPDGLRASLLRLHAMLHTVLNEAPLSVATADGTIADCLTDIRHDLEDMQSVLSMLREHVRQLEALTPQGE